MGPSFIQKELFTGEGMTLASSSHAQAGQTVPLELVASSLRAWDHL
jgi:hypothetical protein